nr:hypothetical protein [Kibdelosporangium sp. MJ126-NF4]CTQ93764.1 hypothetical protein [Kibdelosporangium sp. MJ126-NF4]
MISVVFPTLPPLSTQLSTQWPLPVSAMIVGGRSCTGMPRPPH